MATATARRRSLHHMVRPPISGQRHFCQGFESLSVWLDYSDSHVASLARVDVSDDAAFAFMCAANDFALGTVLQFGWLFRLHLDVRFGVDCNPTFSISLLSFSQVV